MPTRLPAVAAMWASSRVVVLLPLVPVMATIGIRADGQAGQRPQRHCPQAAQLAATVVLAPSAIRAAAAPTDCAIVRRRQG